MRRFDEKKTIRTTAMMLALIMIVFISSCGTDFGEDDCTSSITQTYIIDFDIQIYSPDTVPSLLGDQIFKDYSYSSGEENEYRFLIVFVEGSLGGCDYHHQTTLPIASSSLYETPLWHNGDTLEIEIMRVQHSSECLCPEGIFPYREVIFLGFFLPGEYTLTVNQVQKQFTVGNP